LRQPFEAKRTTAARALRAATLGFHPDSGAALGGLHEAPVNCHRIIEIGEEGGEFFVIESTLSWPFTASRAKEQLDRRGFDNLPVDAVPEQLRRQSGHAIGHDRGRAVDNRVQELDHFPRLDRARISVRPLGELLLKDSFCVFWVLAALAQVALSGGGGATRSRVNLPK
jgi:hypothetical protein